MIDKFRGTAKKIEDIRREKERKETALGRGLQRRSGKTIG